MLSQQLEKIERELDKLVASQTGITAQLSDLITKLDALASGEASEKSALSAMGADIHRIAEAICGPGPAVDLNIDFKATPPTS